MQKYLQWQELRTSNEIGGVESLNKSNKSNRRSLLLRHKNKREVWNRDNRKRDFSKAVFTNKSKFMLDGPGGKLKGWVLQEREALVIVKRQHVREIMLWAEIYSDRLLNQVQ